MGVESSVARRAGFARRGWLRDWGGPTLRSLGGRAVSGDAEGMAKRARLPVFTSLHGYRAGWLGGDLVAGLTVWAVLVPEALAYASIAGVSPVVGLYAAPGALIFYAAFGSSRHLVVGPMAATAALSAAAVGQLVAGKSGLFPALTATLAITTGVLALAAGLARLGFVAKFISEPVLKGFIVGLALTIIVGQVPKLLGISKGEGISSTSCGTWSLILARPRG